MGKKILITFITLLVYFGMVHGGSVLAAPGHDLRMIPVIVNGYKVYFPDTEPYINTDGRTMVPVRFVSEKLGADVEWENDTQTVIITHGAKEIQMSVGSREVSVDGEVVRLDTAAELHEGRTMVPIRFVSEVLGSTVEWDNDAHAVRVTDSEYQAKIDAGEVRLDPWGREILDVDDPNWIKLADLEERGFYDFQGPLPSREFLDYRLTGTRYKEVADILAEKIRSWYAVQLNIDYRTIDEEELIEAYMNSASGRITMHSSVQFREENTIRDYVKWVKENKVIAVGYADPEPYTIYRAGSLLWFPTHFKFKILSAEDSSQTFIDNWAVGTYSESFELEKNVWYDGYGVATMNSVVANSTWGESLGLRTFDSMFVTGAYFYDKRG